MCYNKGKLWSIILEDDRYKMTHMIWFHFFGIPRMWIFIETQALEKEREFSGEPPLGAIELFFRARKTLWVEIMITVMFMNQSPALPNTSWGVKINLYEKG